LVNAERILKRGAKEIQKVAFFNHTLTIETKKTPLFFLF